MVLNMTNSQKGVPVGFLPLKTLNNFLRIKHKDIYFCCMMHFEVVIAYMQKEITYVFRFSFKYVFLWQKMSFFFKEKTSHFGGVFSGNSHFNCWCIFSDIYDSPHCKRVGEQSSVWIGGFQQKILEIWPPKKISVSLHISVNFHLQH